MTTITPCDIFAIMARLPGGWVAFRYPAVKSCRIVLMKGTYAAAGTGPDHEAASKAVVSRVDDQMDGPTASDVLCAIVTALAASYQPGHFEVDDEGCITPIRRPCQALPN